MIRRLLPFDGPVRVMAVATLITTVGTGLWYSSWAIFFTRSVGLSSDQLAAGITAAGLLGLVVATPVGRLADRVGPREVLMVVTSVQAVAMAAYTLVHGFGTFLAVAAVAITAERAYLGVRMALVTGLIADHEPTGDAEADAAHREEVQRERLDVLAYLRSVNHVGFAVGAALAAVVLQADTRPVYVAMVVLNAATFAAYVALLTRVPRVAPCAAASPDRPVAVVRDVPFLVVTALSSVLALCWGMLSTGVPLWITEHTGAPHWAQAMVVFLNAVGVAAFQRRASRGSDAPERAARAAARAGVLLAVSCLVFAASWHTAGALAVAVLLAAAVIHVVGELLYAASAWGLSIALMPDNAHGEYQGMFAAGTAVVQMVAPALMMLLVVGWGVAGWLVLAGVFLAAGLPTVAVARWAAASRAPVLAPVPAVVGSVR